MTDTSRRTDKEALRIMMELLIEHFQQDQEDEAAALGEEEADVTEHGQVALPLALIGTDTGDEEEPAPLAPQAYAGTGEAAPTPWEAYLDEDPTKKRSTSLIMSKTLRAKLLWVVDNVPKISQQKVIHAGAEAEADRLIALHQKHGR